MTEQQFLDRLRHLVEKANEEGLPVHFESHSTRDLKPVYSGPLDPDAHKNWGRVLAFQPGRTQTTITLVL